MGHGSIHLSLASTLAQFCGTFNRFCENYGHQVLVPIVGKDLEQNRFLGLVLEAIEGLINRGFF